MPNNRVCCYKYFADADAVIVLEGSSRSYYTKRRKQRRNYYEQIKAVKFNRRGYNKDCEVDALRRADGERANLICGGVCCEGMCSYGI